MNLEEIQEAEGIWNEFSSEFPEALDAVEYRFSEEFGEPTPCLPRGWTIRMMIYMAMNGHCTIERAFALIWELALWNESPKP
jgi:hypothetical protein